MNINELGENLERQSWLSLIGHGSPLATTYRTWLRFFM